MKSSTKIGSVATILAAVVTLMAVTLFSPSRRTAPQFGFDPIAVLAQNQGIVSLTPNFRPPAMVFTATAQTKTITLPGVGSVTVQVFGPATAATITCKASNDGGVNFFGVPYTNGTFTTNVLQVTAGGTAIAYAGTPLLEYFNLSGFTQFQCATSSTFTGASASVQLTGSSTNRGIF